MRWTVVTLATSLGLLLASPMHLPVERSQAAVASPADVSAQEQGDPGAGAELFEAHCAACHGRDAGGAIGPPIGLTTLSPSEVRDLVANGRRARADGTGGMPAFGGGLSDQELQDVAAFVVSLTQGGAASDFDRSDGESGRAPFGREAILIALLIVMVLGALGIALRRR